MALVIWCYSHQYLTAWSGEMNQKFVYVCGSILACNMEMSETPPPPVVLTARVSVYDATQRGLLPVVYAHSQQVRPSLSISKRPERASFNLHCISLDSILLERQIITDGNQSAVDNCNYAGKKNCTSR